MGLEECGGDRKGRLCARLMDKQALTAGPAAEAHGSPTTKGGPCSWNPSPRAEFYTSMCICLWWSHSCSAQAAHEVPEGSVHVLVIFVFPELSRD